jgi:hypothetical protein
MEILTVKSSEAGQLFVLEIVLKKSLSRRLHLASPVGQAWVFEPMGEVSVKGMHSVLYHAETVLWWELSKQIEDFSSRHVGSPS